MNRPLEQGQAFKILPTRLRYCLFYLAAIHSNIDVHNCSTANYHGGNDNNVSNDDHGVNVNINVKVNRRCCLRS